MHLIRLMVLLLVIAPNQSLASELLSANELKYLIRTCLSHFSQRSGAPIKVDQSRLAKMGFKTKKNKSFDFEAQRVVHEGVYRFSKKRFGPTIELDRNRKKPDAIKFWSCDITTGDDLQTTRPFITRMSSTEVQKLMESEAARLGFRPVAGKRGAKLWIKNGVPLIMNVLFYTTSGTRADNKTTPAQITFQGAHPKFLP